MPSCKTSLPAPITSDRVLYGKEAQYALAPALGANAKQLLDVITDPHLSAADKYLITSRAALTNERYLYKRFGLETLAKMIQNVDNNSPNDIVLVQGCLMFATEMCDVLFAGQQIDSVYAQMIQLWEDKATYTFARGRMSAVRYWQRKGYHLKPYLRCQNRLDMCLIGKWISV